jgi:hypothetical protein
MISQPTQEGEGLIGDLYRGVKDQITKSGTAVKNIFTKGTEYALTTRPLIVKELLQKKGELSITKVVMCRKPINSYFQSFFNLVTLGHWNRVKKKMNFDSVFHLYAKVYLSDGSYISIEKNQRLSILYNKELSGKGECIDASPAGSYTVTQMIDGIEKRLGENAYRYDSLKYNCQNFISNLTQSIGINRDQWILQDTSELFPKWARYLAGKTTDIASLGDYVAKGGKRNRKKRKMMKA